MASKSVKKEGWGQKCASYLELPVCPNCGSPNLHELEKRGNVTNCICDRCDTKCWFDDSFSTEGRETVRFTDNLKIIESTKKSQPATKSFNDMVQKQRNKNIKKDYPWDVPYDERKWNDITEFESYCNLLSHTAQSLEDRIKATYVAYDDDHPVLGALLRDSQDEVKDMKRYINELDRIVENLVQTMWVENR